MTCFEQKLCLLFKPYHAFSNVTFSEEVIIIITRLLHKPNVTCSLQVMNYYYGLIELINFILVDAM